MNTQESTRFNEANKVVHPVEKEWHYPILTQHGYTALTKEGTGFVRSYDYENTTTGSKIRCTTGSHSDYWSDSVYEGHGYWSSLEPHVKALSQQ